MHYRHYLFEIKTKVYLTVVGCVSHARLGVYTIDLGLSLIIPNADAARKTDDLRGMTDVIESTEIWIPEENY